MGFERLEAGEPFIRADIALDLLQPGLGHEGTDVVYDQPRDRRRFAGRDRHAHEAAHRGPDPVDPRDLQALEKSAEVADIARQDIVFGIGQPTAAPAPDHVHRDDARAASGQRPGQDVEVSGVAGQAVHADDGAFGRSFAPVDIAELDAVERLAQADGRELHRRDCRLYVFESCRRFVGALGALGAQGSLALAVGLVSRESIAAPSRVKRHCGASVRIRRRPSALRAAVERFGQSRTDGPRAPNRPPVIRRRRGVPKPS